MADRPRAPKRGWFVAFLALLVLGGLAVAPWLYNSSRNLPWTQAAQRTALAPLPTAPVSLPALQLSFVAQPQAPSDAPAAAPPNDSNRMAALVAAEDNRLRTVIHRSGRITVPQIVAVAGSVPTLVLPARPGSVYTIADLEQFGAATPLTNGTGYLLTDNVLVSSMATLQLGGADFNTLLMDSSATGFTSLVTWGGNLQLSGSSAAAPLTVMGWDDVNKIPAQDNGYGRPYIRATGGQLNLKYVNASSLGFWSGRTGGVSWTGVAKHPSTGGATASSFTGDTYGAFLSRTEKVTFIGDRFEGNEVDGLRVHRGANNSVIRGSSAVRNGANGFVVSRGASGSIFSGDLAVHNAGNGFLLDGQALARSGASPSGDRSTATSGTLVELSASRDNLHTGILVEGGDHTLVRDNLVCSASNAIGIRAGATNTSIVGNEVTCGGRVALSIGPAVSGTTVAGNQLMQARIGILVRNSPGVRIMDNVLSGMSVFGISVRGASPGVVGNDNVISGLGLSAVDSRAGAPSSTLSATDTRGWQHRTQLTVLSYLKYHPLLATWAAAVLLVALWALITRFRRRPSAPYRHLGPWPTHETVIIQAARPLATAAAGQAASRPGRSTSATREPAMSGASQRRSYNDRPRKRRR